MLTQFLESVRDGDLIAPRRMAARLRVPLTSLAKMARLNRNTLAANSGSAVVQDKLGEIARIIARAADLTGDEGRAIIWFRHQPIVGFGSTAEQLIVEGHAAAVLAYLDDLENGVYA